MIEETKFEQYIFSDGKILSMICNYFSNKIELRLLIRKYKGKDIVPCTISLYFEEVYQLDVLDEFSTSGNHSDVVLTKLANGQFYASFDPYGNSGEPNEKDNFVIKAKNCFVDEVP